MTMTFDEDRAAVRERLLELLLEEEFTASTDVAPARLAELAPPVSAPRPRSQRLLVAAAALLGCSAVVATAWFARGGVADAPRREGAQDPAPSAAVVVRDAEHLRTLLGSATGFRFVRREVIGVNRTVTANGFSDQLRTVAWSDDPRPIDGGVSREILRQEFGRSVGDAVAKNGVSHILDLVEDLCSHLLILHRGECLYFGTLAEARTAFDDLHGDATLEEIFLRATRVPGATPPPLTPEG